MADDLTARRRAFLLGQSLSNAPIANTPQDPAAAVGKLLSDTVAGATAVVQQEEARKRKLTDPGVPLDTQTGSGTWDRFQLGLRRGRDNQIKYLQDKYGPDAVREVDGELIFRVMDAKTGKPRDITVDESKMTGRDAIDILGIAPEVLIGILAARGGKPTPASARFGERLWGGAKALLKSSAAAEATGAVKDAAADVADFGAVDAPEILKERGKLLGIDMAVGGAAAPLAGIFKWTMSPLAKSRGQLQFDRDAGAAALKAKYGIEIPQTVGETTGSPSWLRVEAFGEKRAGAAKAYKEIKEAQQKAILDLQARMVGQRLPDDEVGQAAMDALRAATKPADEAADAARRATLDAQEKGLQRAIASQTAARPEVHAREIGSMIRKREVALRDNLQLKAEQLFDEVKKAPGGQGKVFPADTLAKEAETLLKSLPRQGNVPMKDWVPDDVVNRLNSLISQRGQKLSLSDLQQMRRDTYEAMPRMEGVPGRGAHYLGKVADMLTKAIDDGVNSLPTSDLKTKLARANKFYKEKVVPFNRIGLTEMFRAADEMGHIGDSALALRVVGNPDQWRLVKETLGETSREFSRLKRFVADDLLHRSGDAMKGGAVDADLFIRNLTTFAKGKESREIAEDVFGKDISDLLIRAKQLRLASGAKMDRDELASLLSQGKVSTKQLQDLVRAQAAQDAAYKNKIVRAIAGKDVGEETIRPSEFVARVINSSKFEAKEVEDLILKIASTPGGTETVGKLRSKTMEFLLHKAGRPLRAEEIARVVNDPNIPADALALGELMRDPKLTEKARYLLGPAFDDVVDYLKAMGPMAHKEEVFRTAGGWSAGVQTAQIMRGPLKYAGEWVKDRVASIMMLSPSMRRWMASIGAFDIPTAPVDQGAVGRAVFPVVKIGYDTLATTTATMLSSPVFLREVLLNSGEEEAKRIIDSVKSSTDNYVVEETDKQLKRQNFLRGQ